MTMTATTTAQDRIADALARINARGYEGSSTRLVVDRAEQNNGVVVWSLAAWRLTDTNIPTVTLNLCRSDDTMADLLDVIAVLTEGEG